MAVAASWRSAGQAAALRRWDVPLVLVVVYVAALLVLPNEVGWRVGGFVLSPSRVLLVLLAGVVLASAPLRERLLALPKLVLIGWLAFLASAAVSLALNYSSQSLARYGSLVAEGLMLWAIAWCVIRSRRDATVLQVAIVVATTVVAAATLLLALLNVDYGDALRRLSLAAPLDGEVRFGFSRQTGSFPQPLFYATWLVGTSMLILGWLEDPRRNIRILAWLAWAILFVATIATVSRLAIVGDLAATGAYFLLRRRYWMSAWLFAAAILAALIVNGVISVSISISLPFGSSGGHGPVSPGGSTADQRHLAESQAMRLDSLRAAWPVLLEKPLFGWGLLNAASVLSAHLGRPTFVDDTYVNFLVELGIVGSAAMALLLVAAVRQSLLRPLSAVRLPLLFAPAMLLGMMVFASFLNITQGFAGFVLLVTLAMVHPAGDGDTDEPDIRSGVERGAGTDRTSGGERRSAAGAATKP